MPWSHTAYSSFSKLPDPQSRLDPMLGNRLHQDFNLCIFYHRHHVMLIILRKSKIFHTLCNTVVFYHFNRNWTLIRMIYEYGLDHFLHNRVILRQISNSCMNE